MPREKEDFRANLERINEIQPFGEMLNLKAVVNITGWSTNTAKKYVPFKDGWVSKATLARVMCPD